jgi:hypothetical protein
MDQHQRAAAYRLLAEVEDVMRKVLSMIGELGNK